MHLQVNGTVEVRFQVRDEPAEQCLYFDDHEFQHVAGNGLTLDAGEPTYSGILQAIQEGIQLRLAAVVDRNAVYEKGWEIVTVRSDVINPAVAADELSFEFVNDAR